MTRDQPRENTTYPDLAPPDLARLAADHTVELLVVVGASGEILWANRTAEEVLGFRVADVAGSSVLRFVHPDDTDLAARTLLQVRGGRRTEWLTLRLRHTSGDTFSGEVASMPPPPGGELGERMVVSVRMRSLPTPAAPAAERAVLFELLHRVRDGVTAVDTDGTVVFRNQSALELCRIANSQSGLPLAPGSRILTPDGEPDDPFRRALGGDSFVAERRLMQFGDGIETVLEVSGDPLFGPDGAVTGAVVTLRDLTDQIRHETTIYELAFSDQLTELPNRRYLDAWLESHTPTADSRLAVLFVDLDHFKDINDTYGHAWGDAILRLIGERLAGSVVGHDALLVRVAGDEFVVTLECESEAELAELADRVLRDLSVPVLHEGISLTLTASIGVVLLDEHPASETVLRCADAAMYEAKRGGRNQWRRYEPSMLSQVGRRLAVHQQLRRVLAAGEVQVRFQALHDLHDRSGEVGGYEVLARIPDGDGGFLPTEEAIAMAEAAGAIADLDRAVLTAAVTAASILHARGGPPAFVACNLSGRTLGDPHLHDRVADLLDEHGLPPSALWLECTERIAAELDERSFAQLAALRDLGVEIAMDDFGTGHSSLDRFRSLPFTVLKLARSFVSPLPGTPQDRAIVAAILHLAAAFGVDVVAEGVETDEQAAFLAATGVRWTQGYLYGKPLSVLDLVGSAPLTAPRLRGRTSR